MGITTIKRCLAVLLVMAGVASTPARADSVNLALGVLNPLRTPLPVAFTVQQSTSLSGTVNFSATLGALLLDTQGNGVSLAPVGGFILEGLINGVPVGMDSLGTLTTSLLPTTVFTGTFSCGGPCGTLSLVVNFLLSPFDAATLLANFTVTAAPPPTVPEPSSWLLLVAALGALTIARRRQASRPARNARS